MVDAEAIVADVIKALDATGVPYMLVGSFSSNLYGVPRSTKDADFVLELGDTTINDLLKRLGPDYSLDEQMSFETITGTYRYKLRHVASAFTIELFMLSADAHDRERFARRGPHPFLGGQALLPTPEDVIVTKLRWSVQGRRAKDVQDVANVIALNRATLDWDYVRRWCDAHGTRQLLDRLAASTQ